MRELYQEAKKSCLGYFKERGKIRISGPEAEDFLESQLTNKITGLEDGQGVWALILTPKGKVLNETRVLKSGSRYWLDYDLAHDLTSHLKRLSLGREVRFEELGAEYFIYSLIGPQAEQLVGQLIAGTHDFTKSEGLLYVKSQLGIDVIGHQNRISQIDLLKDLVSEAPLELREAIRIEMGIPSLESELAGRLPQEAGIGEEALSFNKGCYVGQETVARLHFRGRARYQLRGADLKKDAKPKDRLTMEGVDKPVGEITSISEHPVLGYIALALVRSEVEPGSQVFLNSEPALLVELPFTL